MDPNFLNQAQSLIPAEVRMISGCEDYQTSADVSNVSKFSLPDPAGRAGGACTSALLDIVYANKSLTFQQVLMKLREKLDNDGFSQIPQLTSSRPLDLQEVPFHLVGGSGEKRAVLVGLNYPGQNGELSGCHNDAFNMKKYIQNVHGFPEKNITLLVDDGSNAFPTRVAMIQALKTLVAKSVSGDSVFFHYSGHGGLLEADGNAFKNNKDEYDQTLIPLDYESVGQIRDFTLFNNFIQPMAAGVTVTCVMDCCHSGSVLDLPYTFKATNVGEAPRMIENVDCLSNLAFLYMLAGHVLPAGFQEISGLIDNVVGGNLEDYQGLGLQDEEAQGDFQIAPLEESPQEYNLPDDVAEERDSAVVGHVVGAEEQANDDDDEDCCCGIMEIVQSLFEGGDDDDNE